MPKYVASTLFDDKLSEKDRAKSSQLFDIIQEQLEHFVFDEVVANQRMLDYLETSDIFHIFNINTYGNELQKVIEEADLNDAFHTYINRNQ